MKRKAQSKAIMLDIKSRRSRYAALACDRKRTVLAEGMKIDTVMRKADKTGLRYSMITLPPFGRSLILEKTGNAR